MPRLEDALSQELAELEAAHLLRKPRVIDGPQGPVVEIGGREVLCFSSNNYLGLADAPELVEAAREALASHGLGAGASRLITGSMGPHRVAEERLAAFVDAPTARLFANGYAANVGVLSALFGPDDVLFSDRLNHASLIDGCRLSRATVHIYPHRDTGALAELLATHAPSARRAAVVTDGVFSMDGVRAPLSTLHGLCDAAGCWLLVDEAHALGVVGPGGRGACAEAGIRPDVLIGTLGKAFGVSGAFVAGPAQLARVLEHRARSYVFSTAPSPAVAAAAARAADLVAGADERRARVTHHASRIRSRLRELGWDARGEDGVPIVPVVLGDPRRTMLLSEALFEHGVLAQGIRPPTVPKGTSRVRLAPMASHTDAHVDRLLTTFEAMGPP